MDHERYMKQALREAHKALDAGEVPIGAVIVMQDKIIGRGYNQVEKLNDATAHAEIIALTSAFHYLGSKYLPGATIYVTIEPCFMCCGALYWSKISGLAYGAADPKHGGISAFTTGLTSLNKTPLHPKTTLMRGVLENECVVLLKDFFRTKR